VAVSVFDLVEIVHKHAFVFSFKQLLSVKTLSLHGAINHINQKTTVVKVGTVYPTALVQVIVQYDVVLTVCQDYERERQGRLIHLNPVETLLQTIVVYLPLTSGSRNKPELQLSPS